MHLVSDFCNRLNVNSRSRLKHAIVRNSKLVVRCLLIIYKLGFIFSFKILNFKHLKVVFKFTEYSESALRGINSISKPSLKIYFKKKNLQRNALINKGKSNGFIIMSTSNGIMTDIECIFNSTGGIPLLSIY